MATITLKGNSFQTSGELPAAGSLAPDFKLVGSNLSDMALSEMKGKKVVLNIFPSLDTDVCAASVRRFNEKASGLCNTLVLAISMDLPFAMGRFCTTEGIENVTTLSAFRNHDFAKNYGLGIIDGPLAGLLARSVVVIDETGQVVYTELVPEIVQEPDYDKALAAI